MENNETNNIGADNATLNNPSVGFIPNEGENLNDPNFGGFSEPANNTSANEDDFSDSESKPSVASPIVGDIAKRLSEAGNEGKVNENANEIIPQESAPFDLSKMTPEQLQTLKSMLNATPDRISKKKGNPTVTLRQTEDGRFIVKFKKAYLTMMMNEVLQAKEPILVIPVQFYGEEGFTDMRWDAFQELRKVTCEVLDDLSKTEEYDDGITVSRETGQEVVMTKTVVRHYFKVKLSDTASTTIEAEYANA